jgi:hypothetical protein
MKAQQTIKDPKGLDRALMALRTSIASTCDWLDNVYGEAEARGGRHSGRRASVPAAVL